MDLIIYWRFESPGRISDLMLYFHLSHCPYKCTPLNPRYALLKVLDLAGAVVSIDAMGCQTAIATQIVAQQGDYVLALKGNQGNLHQDVRQLFDHAQSQKFRDTALLGLIAPLDTSKALF